MLLSIIMKKHLIQCLSTLSIWFLLVNLPSVASDSPSSTDEDPDSEYKQFYQQVDTSDWANSRDMFTYDPSSKTNREMKFSEAAEKVVEMIKERKRTNDLEASSSSDCDELRTKLKLCESSQKSSQCDCSTNELCGKRSYQIIRRLVMMLSKRLEQQYIHGLTGELKVNLDDIFFQMPSDINNSSDCDYLIHFHHIIDQLVPSIAIYKPESYKLAEDYMLLKFGATSFGGLIIAISIFRMPWKLRLFSFFIIFLIVSLIWEYALLYQTEMAKVEEKSNRLKNKCESQASSNWFGWFPSLIPTLAFGSEASECTDYYISTRVDPLLAVNPILVFSKLYERTILYAMTLTANATGHSIKAFFSHIPTIWIPIFIIAGVVVIIFTLKYCFKYRNLKPKRTKSTKPRTPSIRKETRKAELTSPRTRAGLPRIGMKLNQSGGDSALSTYGSTGNIHNLGL